MPFYQFQNKNTLEIVDVFFHMNDEKVYNGKNNDEKDIWVRIWTKPNAAIDTKVDPYSGKDFVKATAKKSTIGAMLDRSAELSEKRKSKDGIDPVKEQFYKEYSEKRKGKLHPEKRKEMMKEKIKGIATVEF